jgi:hypothetical protein
MGRAKSEKWLISAIPGDEVARERQVNAKDWDYSPIICIMILLADAIRMPRSF